MKQIASCFHFDVQVSTKHAANTHCAFIQKTRPYAPQTKKTHTRNAIFEEKIISLSD